MIKKTALTMAVTIGAMSFAPSIPAFAQEELNLPVKYEYRGVASYNIEENIETQSRALWTAQTTQATWGRNSSNGQVLHFAAGAGVIVNTLQTHQFATNGPQYVRIVSGPGNGLWIRRSHLRDAPGVIPYQFETASYSS